LTEPKGLGRILELVKDIVSGSKTGTAIDRYRIMPLWDLGGALGEVDAGGAAIWFVIDSVLRKDGILAKPTLLRTATRVRRYWASKAAFERVAGVLGSYGKLKDVIQIFNPEVAVPQLELDQFLLEVAGTTYVETLDAASRLKAKYIRGELGGAVDSDTLYETIQEATSEIEAIIENGDDSALSRVRAAIQPEESRSLRMLLSSLQSEAVHDRYASEIRRSKLPSPGRLDSGRFPSLAAAVRALEPLRSIEPSSLKRVSREFGLSFLGDMATVLKATESDEEKRRFLKNREVIRKFLAQSGG
jgi:hypothetical protein